MNNTKRTILALVIIIIVLFLGIRGCMSLMLSSALKTNKEVSELDSNTYLKSVPEEYLGLFLNKANILPDSSVTSKQRSLVSQLHNEKYYIQVYKLDTINGLSLSSIIFQTFDNSEISMYSYYVEESTNKQLRIRYKLGQKEKTSSLYFTLYGDHTQVIEKNDSVAYYYSNFENFSIKYKKNDKIDIYGNKRGTTPSLKVPIEIMFLKRTNNLHFILLSNKNNSSNLDKYALYNLIIRNTSIR